MLIMLAILVIFAFAYVVKCVRRQWISRTRPVSPTNTATLNEILNESHQTRYFYDQIEDVERNDSERYLTPACDDLYIKGNCPDRRAREEKKNLESTTVTSGPLNDEIPYEGKVSEENDMYENNLVKDHDGLYITPCM